MTLKQISINIPIEFKYESTSMYYGGFDSMYGGFDLQKFHIQSLKHNIFNRWGALKMNIFKKNNCYSDFDIHNDDSLFRFKINNTNLDSGSKVISDLASYEENFIEEGYMLWSKLSL